LLDLLAAVQICILKKCLYYICRVYVVYPDEFHNGLWGGEGVVKGLLKRQAQRKRNTMNSSRVPCCVILESKIEVGRDGVVKRNAQKAGSEKEKKNCGTAAESSVA
jgi:hypothetical protein